MITVDSWRWWWGRGSSTARGGEWTRAVAMNAKDGVLHGTDDSCGQWGRGSSTAGSGGVDMHGR